MKRRNFLQGAAALTIPALMPITGARGGVNRFTNLIAPDNDRVLVIIHLFGGNDGLNTVIPIDQYDSLHSVRNRFTIDESKVLKVTDKVALHPSMDDMQVLFKEDRLKIIQSVGYPNPVRSHFRSTDIWTSGSSSEVFEPTGWVGRYLETVYPGFPAGYPSSSQPHPPAISIGDVSHPTCEGTSGNLAQTVLDPNNTQELNKLMNMTLPDDRYGKELDFIRTTMTQTNAYNQVIEEAANRGKNAVAYSTSGNDLAGQLQKVARMIAGGLKTKVYTVYMGGFDTHAQQVLNDTTNGKHAHLLRYLSDAIGDFQRDLRAQGLEERVMGLTFSEFGRRIRPNASMGTDHGDAGPMFLFGSCVNGGVLGKNVEVDKDVSQSDGVPMQFDFRDVYGSILVDWFNVMSSQVRDLLHEDFQYIPVADTCNDKLNSASAGETTDDGWFIGQIYPNPAKSEVRVTIESPTAGNMRYSLFDARGRLVLVNQIKVSGRQELVLFNRPSRLPSGTYVLRMATEGGSSLTRKILFE
ncbi:DUF1501 domain-containing protein [Lewinella sp. IMCC34191]|uniref:DUF1501 domain-containing protein n=1 Tax=Lewinella sp. IMCC34191 TaxID=2259172 RepID=UPI000E251AB3|nr:DUF1501 domain-containing protein [Lewinella sp. IMCC34191]